MMTIGRMLCCFRNSSCPQRQHFAEWAWLHSWRLVKTVAVGIKYTIEARRAQREQKREAVLRLPLIGQLVAEMS